MAGVFLQPLGGGGGGQAVVVLLEQHPYGVVITLVHCALSAWLQWHGQIQQG